MIYQIAGYLSGIAITLSFVPYIRDIFLKITRPGRTSWLIWSILGAISFFSQFAKGASYSLVLSGVQTIGDLFIFILAIRFGLGGWQKRDKIALVGVVISLVLWYITREAAVALFIAIFIDATGAVLTMLKAYEHPATETISSWVLTFIGGVFGCIAVGSLNLVLLAFPVYICLASLGVLIAIKFGLKNQLFKSDKAIRN